MFIPEVVICFFDYRGAQLTRYYYMGDSRWGRMGLTIETALSRVVTVAFEARYFSFFEDFFRRLLRGASSTF